MKRLFGATTEDRRERVRLFFREHPILSLCILLFFVLLLLYVFPRDGNMVLDHLSITWGNSVVESQLRRDGVCFRTSYQ